MGGVNSIPVVSQAKSGVQLICGDTEGAKATQKDFLQECPVVSQVTSTVQVLAGDVDGAIETQKKCGEALLRTADGIPVVGHAKGVIHYACGDTEGGNKAMRSATRTTAVMGSGAAGFVVGGPVGAVALGIAGGASYDTTATVIDSTVNDEFTPSGYVAAIDNIAKNPNPGDIFDACFMPVADGLAGYSGGQMASKFSGTDGATSGTNGGPPPSAAEMAQATALEAQAEALLEAAEAGKMTMPGAENLQMYNEAMNIWKEAQDLKGAPKPTNIKVPTQSASTGASRAAAGSAATAAQNDKDQTQSTMFGQNKMWVLWISDDVFVAGTDKAIVELSTAFLVKDISLVERICSELGINPESIFGEKYATLTYEKIAELAFKTQSGCRILQEDLVELIKKGGKKSLKAVEMFFKDLFKQNNETKEKDKRSQRGEHVINNAVINVYRDIMNMFLFRNGITRDGVGSLNLPNNYSESQIIQDCDKYFDSKTKSDIQDVLKVFIDQDVTYIDANAFLYGWSINVLKESAVEHMTQLYARETYRFNEGTRVTRSLKNIVSQINEHLLYVDETALSLWLARKGPSGRHTYEKAQRIVERMFDELYEKLGQWVRELKRSGH